MRMAGPGGGPSRRSHTKSRKGCKTCKKRHIRCDETFPQCRNCTKHQVRCDYMDLPTLGTPESPDGPRTANLLWTLEIESTIEIWRRTGEFPFPDLRTYPQPSWNTYNNTELRLVHHLASIANETLRNRTAKLTVWTDMFPKILQVATDHQFVMHAILAFSASHLAWISQSTETRNLSAHYSNVAMKGLQQAMGLFSKQNADAILAASLLLQWRATEWREWASIVTSTTKAIHMMKSWKDESLFADVLAEHGVVAPQTFMNPVGTYITPDLRRDHLVVLDNVQRSLAYLASYLAQYDLEARWVDQLRQYAHELNNKGPVQSTEEQFKQLYALRKYLLWVPISLLAAKRSDAMIYMVLSHFYSTALALEPLFPDVGGAFCSTFALQPLEHTIQALDAQTQQGFGPVVPQAMVVMDFPKETASSYRQRRTWTVRQRMDSFDTVRSPYGLDTLHLDLEQPIAQFNAYGPSTQSLSPAIPPSPLISLQNTTYSGQPATWLDVPRTTSIDFGTSANSFPISYSSAPQVSSPLVSPTSTMPYTSADEAAYSTYGMSMGYPGGFVTTTPTVWT